MSWPDPVSAFRDLAGAHPRMFWLDGGGSREWSGRRSILGWLEDDDVSLTYDAATREVWRHVGGDRELVGDDVFAALEQETARDADDPSVSWSGATSGTPRGPTCRRSCGRRSAPGTRRDVDAHRADRGLRPRTRRPARCRGRGRTGTGRPAPHVPQVGREEYDDWFGRVQQQLRLGNSYEVNLTYREEVASRRRPGHRLPAAARGEPAPYAGYLQRRGQRAQLEPERFATVDRNRWVQTKPIKGTTPRGRTAAEDHAHWRRCGPTRGFRAENLMIVDLLRNDLSMVCEPGTVTVPQLMEVESYATVHQLVSTVRGHLRDGISTMAALAVVFPAGSMTGAPKLRTIEVIADVETSPRRCTPARWAGQGRRPGRPRRGDPDADLARGAATRSAPAAASHGAFRCRLGVRPRPGGRPPGCSQRRPRRRRAGAERDDDGPATPAGDAGPRPTNRTRGRSGGGRAGRWARPRRCRGWPSRSAPRRRWTVSVTVSQAGLSRMVATSDSDPETTGRRPR